MNFAGTKNIIFDLDGTLIDSSRGVVEATNYALVKLGQARRSADEIRRFIGYSLDEMFPAFCDAPLDQLKAAFQERARLVVVASARPMPGAAELLPRLYAAGYRLAIATTKFTPHTEGTVRKFGWRQYFSALASGDEVANVKPAPDLIRLALQRLGADPAETVMVGDTINDILAARAAEVGIISIRSPFGDDDLRRFGPDLILDSLGQLADTFTR